MDQIPTHDGEDSNNNNNGIVLDNSISSLSGRMDALHPNRNLRPSINQNNINRLTQERSISPNPILNNNNSNNNNFSLRGAPPPPSSSLSIDRKPSSPPRIRLADVVDTLRYPINNNNNNNLPSLDNSRIKSTTNNNSVEDKLRRAVRKANLRLQMDRGSGPTTLAPLGPSRSRIGLPGALGSPSAGGGGGEYKEKQENDDEDDDKYLPEVNDEELGLSTPPLPPPSLGTLFLAPSYL